MSDSNEDSSASLQQNRDWSANSQQQNFDHVVYVIVHDSPLGTTLPLYQHSDFNTQNRDSNATNGANDTTIQPIRICNSGTSDSDRQTTNASRSIDINDEQPKFFQEVITKEELIINDDHGSEPVDDESPRERLRRFVKERLARKMKQIETKKTSEPAEFGRKKAVGVNSKKETPEQAELRRKKGSEANRLRRHNEASKKAELRKEHFLQSESADQSTIGIKVTSDLYLIDNSSNSVSDEVLSVNVTDSLLVAPLQQSQNCNYETQHTAKFFQEVYIKEELIISDDDGSDTVGFEATVEEESPRERARRLAREWQVTYRARIKAMETPEKAEIRKKKTAEAEKRRRQNATTEQTMLRRKKNAEANKRRRQNLTTKEVELKKKHCLQSESAKEFMTEIEFEM